MKSISKEKRLKVYSIFNGRCAYCGCDIYLESFHIDHINPLFRGLSQEEMNRTGYNRVKGTNNIENLYPSCPSCNCSKSTYTIEEWRNVIELKKEHIKKKTVRTIIFYLNLVVLLKQINQLNFILKLFN